jgi:hypothetical protein
MRQNDAHWASDSGVDSGTRTTLNMREAAPDQSEEISNDGERDEQFEAGIASPPEAFEQDAAPSATFSVSNPLRGLSATAIVEIAASVFVALILGWARKRLRKGARKDDNKAWAWRTDNTVPAVGMPDLSRPMLGASLVISEKYVSNLCSCQFYAPASAACVLASLLTSD